MGFDLRIFQTGLGVGDILLATGVLRGWRRVNRQKPPVITRLPELFQSNPDTAWVWPESSYQRLIEALGKPLIWRIGSWLNGSRLQPVYPFPCRGRHLIDAMADSVGISLLPEEHRPFLFIARRELQQQSWARGWIAVQSSSTSYWTVNKNWAPGRMQQVVDALLKHGMSAVQLGAPEDEKLLGVKDLRGKTTLRQAAAILANCRLLIGLEGGLVHLARAVDTPAVVIYSGYTLPEETGYTENINLRSPAAGASCWMRTPCDHCRQSMEDITVDQVVDAVIAWDQSNKKDS